MGPPKSPKSNFVLRCSGFCPIFSAYYGDFNSSQAPESEMFEPKSLLYRATRRFFPPGPGKQEHQRRLMAAAFSLLVIALVVVLYHDRDFWFPDAQDAEDEV